MAAERLVVLVTGSRKGIGRALVEHFLAKDASVEGCSRGPFDGVLPGYVHHRVDVAREDEVKAMIASIAERHGRLDVIVNNAGVASMNHVLLTPVETFDRILATNVRGTFLVCREGAKVMGRRRWGRIVNMTSVAVPMHLEGEAVYASSKSAVAELTQVLARELAEYGITCNAVGPSPVETDLIRSVPPDKIGEVVKRLAIKRLGTVADVVNAVEFFVRRESDYVTGQVLYLGGP